MFRLAVAFQIMILGLDKGECIPCVVRMINRSLER